MSESLTPEERADLRALAAREHAGSQRLAAGEHSFTGDEMDDMIRWTSARSPQRILGLLDDIERLERERDEAKRALDWLAFEVRVILRHEPDVAQRFPRIPLALAGTPDLLADAEAALAASRRLRRY